MDYERDGEIYFDKFWFLEQYIIYTNQQKTVHNKTES